MIREFLINKSLFKDFLVISVVVLYSTIAVYAIETYSVSGTLAPYGQVSDWARYCQRIYLANLDANNEVYYEGILTIEHETDC